MAKLYRFQARNWQGKRVTGRIEAESEEAAVRDLAYQGLFALDVKEMRGPQMGEARFFRKKPKERELAALTRQFASMVRSGLPLFESLQVLESQSESRSLRRVLAGIARSIQRGIPLWAALSDYPSVFSRLYVQTVKAGETSGKLDAVLERLAAYLEREHQVRSKVRNSLIYPGILAVFTAAVLLFLTGFVVPAFASVLAEQGASLPFITSVLLAVAGGLRDHFTEILVLMLFLAAAVKMAAKTPAAGKLIDGLKLRLPIAGRLHLKMAWGRFARTLGLLVGSGVPVLVSLEVAAQTAGNRVFEEHVQAVLRSVERGGSMAASLAGSGIFEPLMVQMVKVGEETGSLDRMLLKAAEYYELETERAVDGLLSVFEPVVVLVMAGIVGTVVVGTLLPVFEMISVVK